MKKEEYINPFSAESEAYAKKLMTLKFLEI